MSLGERVARRGVFISRGETGEGVPPIVRSKMGTTLAPLLANLSNCPPAQNLPPKPLHDIVEQQADQKRSCHDHISVVSERLRKVSVEERGQRPSAAAGGTGGEVE